MHRQVTHADAPTRWYSTGILHGYQGAGAGARGDAGEMPETTLVTTALSGYNVHPGVNCVPEHFSA